MSAGRTVLVTGGSRGLGLGIAQHLSGAGYGVVAVARTCGEPLEAAIRTAGETGAGPIRFVAADLGDTAALPGLARAIRRESGPLWGLVNNAGIGTEGLLATMPDRQIEDLIRVNTLSPVILTKYVVRSMMADGGGRVVNIGSIVATTGYNALSVYSATKAATIGFTKSLAREVGRLGITVNAVAPGFVDTDLTRSLPEAERDRIVRRSALLRLPQVEDVARTVEFLLGEGGRNITGTVITVDAGGTA